MAATRGRRWWGVLGAVLVVIGLGAGALALYGRSQDDGERPVGILTGSDLDAPATSAPGLPAGDGTVPAPVGDGPQWPAEFQGRPPAFGTDGAPPPAEAGDLAPGFYVWSDFAGFHAWLVGDPDGAASLEVVTDDVMTADATGGSPDLEVDEDRFTLRRGDESAEVVGVEFNPGFFVDQLELTVTGDLPLFTGTAATPATSPLTLRYAEPG